jgi:UDPglucose 6-dehydrogenase
VTALTHADVGVVMTEWAAFQTMDLGRMREVMATPTLIDMRYLWDIATMQSLGFTYFPIGTAL